MTIQLTSDLKNDELASAHENRAKLLGVASTLSELVNKLEIDPSVIVEATERGIDTLEEIAQLTAPALEVPESVEARIKYFLGDDELLYLANCASNPAHAADFFTSGHLPEISARPESGSSKIDLAIQGLKYFHIKRLSEEAYAERTGEQVDVSHMPVMNTISDEAPIDPAAVTGNFEVNKNSLAAATEFDHFLQHRKTFLQRLGSTFNSMTESIDHPGSVFHRALSVASGIKGFLFGREIPIQYGVPYTQNVKYEPRSVPIKGQSTETVIDDIPDDVRAAIIGIARKHAVEFAVTQSTFMSSTTFRNELPPRANELDGDGLYGSRGYAGGIRVYFAQDVNQY